MQTLQSKTKVLLSIATLIPHPDYLYKKFYSNIQDVKGQVFYRDYTATLPAPTLVPNPIITLQKYNLQISTAPIPVVGSSNAPAIISIGHNDPTTPNVQLLSIVDRTTQFGNLEGSWFLLLGTMGHAWAGFPSQ
jgi:hypothetical protein